MPKNVSKESYIYSEKNHMNIFLKKNIVHLKIKRTPNKVFSCCSSSTRELQI